MWSQEQKDNFRKFLGNFFSTQSFSVEEEKLWIKSLQHYSPHEVGEAIKEVYAKKEMRRAMPSLKSVLEMLRDKNRYTKKKTSSMEATAGKPFSVWYEDILCNKIQINPKLREFLENPKAYRRRKEG